jgi:lysophospholipase L1-like esterase
MKSLRALSLVAVGGVVLLSCGSSGEASAPPGAGAPDPAPAALPGESPAVPDPAPMTDSAEGSGPAVATPSSEELGENLPIAGDGSGAEPVGGNTESDGAGSAGPPENTGGAAGANETPATPGENVELSPITLWIAGDSTVANGNTPCPRGWGGAFAPHFNDRVTIHNAAAGGRSVHTWLYDVQTVMDETGECALARDASGEPTVQPRWQTMLDGMKPGDYLFIQFGINDGDRTCDRHVGIDAFGTAYGMMAAAARERGAQPIFLTPVSSIACNGTTARGSRGEFVPATLDAGTAFDVPVIDLHERSVALFQERGFCPVAGGDVSAATTGPVGDFFCDDHTHFSSAGAIEIADVVVQALIEQQIPLAAYLR